MWKMDELTISLFALSLSLSLYVSLVSNLLPSQESVSNIDKKGKNLHTLITVHFRLSSLC